MQSPHCTCMEGNDAPHDDGAKFESEYQQKLNPMDVYAVVVATDEPVSDGDVVEIAMCKKNADLHVENWRRAMPGADVVAQPVAWAVANDLEINPKAATVYVDNV